MGCCVSFLGLTLLSTQEYETLRSYKDAVVLVLATENVGSIEELSQSARTKLREVYSKFQGEVVTQEQAIEAAQKALESANQNVEETRMGLDLIAVLSPE